jgi:peptide/nickel transport system substrate-binding protein
MRAGRGISRLAATVVLGLTAVLAPGAASVGAAEFRWTAPSSLPHLDPQALPGSADLGVIGLVYEGLVGRAPDLSLTPALAEAWEPVTTTRWRFHLRRGVRFHDGSALTADDVVASLERAMKLSETQGNVLAPLYRIRRMDDVTVDIYTHDPVGDLPDRLTLAPIMDSVWSRQSNPRVQANGTGPFKVESFTPDGPLALVANGDWWGGPPTSVTRAVLYPAARSRDRLRFLLEDRVDLATDLDPDMVEPLGRTAGVVALTTPGTRVLMLGMNQSNDTLRQGKARGNPFKDRRVREAVARAIDTEALNTEILSGQATPAAVIAAPAINGFPQALNLPMAPNAQTARALLAQAGLGDAGFSITLDCPVGHYPRDTLLCGAIADDLTAVGIRTTVNGMPPETYFPHILKRESDFFLLGWMPGTLEIGNPIVNLTLCPPETKPGEAPPPGPGAMNLAGFCDREVDRLALRLTQAQHPSLRDAAAADALMRLRDTVAYVPLLVQPVIWGARDRIQARIRADGVVNPRNVILDPESASN